MPEKSSFAEGGAVYSQGDVTVYIQQFLERFRAIEAQPALISEKLGIPYENPADTVPREVVELVQAGKRIEAVKRYRQLTNAGVDEAREVISGR
jgi:ribosomal protein L7/L12